MAIITVRSSGTLSWRSKAYRCALGINGVTSRKREGDGATPLGCFPLRRILYRDDRTNRPVSALPVARLDQNDAWCDDPEDHAYNRPVTVPYPGHTEPLWREDGLYDVLAIMGHNDDPVVRGCGSAIFLHVAAPDFAPTRGCIAIAREDLLAILEEGGADLELCVVD